jgi:micrococcal nuclease
MRYDRPITRSMPTRAPTLVFARALVALGVSHLLVGGTLAAQRPDTVWVNARSGVYHCRGTRDYGRTARGSYLLEDDAQQRGHRPNGGRSCPPPGRAAIVRGDTASLPGPFGSRDDGTPVMRAASGLTACTVRRVSDGDTLECDPLGRVRLIGVDAPEGDQEPYATAATAALAAVIPPGSTVLLEHDEASSDRYGRTLAYVWHEGRMVNWLLVRYGWAVPLHYPPNTRHAAALESASARARQESRGLWHVDGFRCLPKARRDRRC